MWSVEKLLNIWNHLTYLHIICLTLIFCVVASYDLVGFFLKFLGVEKKEEKTQLQGFFPIIYHDSGLLKELKARYLLICSFGFTLLLPREDSLLIQGKPVGAAKVPDLLKRHLIHKIKRT